MVNVTKFKLDKHMEVVIDMHRANNYAELSAINDSTIPKIGFIAYSNREYQYIAAGFLRLVEGGFGQIDTLVTNPAIEPSVRNEAIDLLVKNLINAAKDLKLKAIYAFSKDYSILTRAEETGFRVIDQSIIALNL